MEHPILKNGGSRVIIKAQQRSESNVLIKLTPIKTEESRGYVNAGTQQLLKPLTINVRGFLFGVSVWKDQPRVTTPLRARNDVVICGWSCCFSAVDIDGFPRPAAPRVARNRFSRGEAVMEIAKSDFHD